jgi:hypothetical protein
MQFVQRKKLSLGLHYKTEKVNNVQGINFTFLYESYDTQLRILLKE